MKIKNLSHNQKIAAFVAFVSISSTLVLITFGISSSVVVETNTADTTSTVVATDSNASDDEFILFGDPETIEEEVASSEGESDSGAPGSDTSAEQPAEGGGSSSTPDPNPEPSPSTQTPTVPEDPATGGDSPAPSTGRTMIWSDEFDSGLQSHWSKEYSTYGDGNNELQCYTHDQVDVSDGKLILTAIEASTTCPGGDVRTVTSGMVRSSGVVFAPGMSMEWSAKLTPNDEDNQGGLWPALWSSGWAGGGWPLGGEWDGFEVMTAVDPYRTVYSLHYQDSNGDRAKTSTPVYSARKFSDNWHTFRFNYGANGTMTWFRDGYQTKEVTSRDTQQGWPAPFNQDMKEIKINLALGGNPGPLDTRALPATLEIGWIRIYQD